MKNFMLIIVMLLMFSMPMSAQNGEAKGIRAHYTAYFIWYEGQKNKREEEMVLDILPRRTHFYCWNSVMRQAVTDSIMAVGGNYGDLVNAMEKANIPRASLHYQIWKGVPNDSMLTFTDKNFVRFRYTEPVEHPVWTLGTRDSTIIGYHCMQAFTTFHGRKWTVWFTTEIPVSEGPWKLHGLPGLILDAEESDGLFAFYATGIENISQKESRLARERQYYDCDKTEYYRLMRFKEKDPVAFSERFGVTVGPGYDAQGRPIKYPVKKAVFMEKNYEESESQ